MAITKRGNSWQAYVAVDGQRIRKSFSTEEDATVWEALARQAIKHGKPVPNAGSNTTTKTLSQAADAVYKMFWQGGKSDEKMVGYIRQLEQHFGSKYPVHEFTTEVLDNYILDLKAIRNSNATINRKLACISKILKYSKERGWIKEMPVVHRQKEGQNRIRWLTDQEEQTILDTLASWGKFDIMEAFIVSIDTGIRHSEMCRLKTTDLQPDGLYLGETKNGYPRLVPLTTRSKKVLEDRVQRLKSGRIFPKASRDWTRTTFNRMRNLLGMEDVVWHTLRHTTCSRLVQGGLPLVHVKEWMGHEAIQTTMRYAHLAPAHLHQGVSVLESRGVA